MPPNSENSQAGNGKKQTFRILCLSHLVWERQLFQRPQQLMTQFESLGHEFKYISLMSSKRWLRSNAEEKQIQIGSKGNAINIPHIPFQKRMAILTELNQYQVRRECIKYFKHLDETIKILWIQHPEFYRYAKDLSYDLLVYDCMDPFAKFKADQPNIVKYEEELLQQADVVFSGGRSLHSLVENRNQNAHCYPSGIDFDHFAKAAEPGKLPEDIKGLKKPVLGYFGAIDERIDWELTEKLCQAKPDWSIVYIGPLILMDECPIKEPNFHHLGAKKYEILPEYLRTFDVSLIPWLVNDLTSFMSPTKTPEYLASGSPVVSVPIPDVVADYQEEALIAQTADEFIAACEKAVETGKGEASKPPQSRTWREIAEQMETHILTALQKNEIPQ